jgi:DNA end-binding protein Ku
MEVTQFVGEDEIDPEFYEKPYFVVPENESQTEAFLTVRKALQETKKIAITKIAFGGREHIVALAPGGKAGRSDTEETGGMMAYTLRYAAELRKPAEYFSDIKHHSIDKESLDLAKELIKRRTHKFDPEKFVDGYEVAVKELVEAKLKHLPIPKDEAPAPAKGKVVNLMDALRKSVSGGGAAEEHASAKRASKKTAAEKKPVSITSGKKPPRSEKSARSTHKRKSA